MIKNKEEYVSRAFRVKKTTLAELHRLADSESRTLVNFVGIILDNFIKTGNKSSKK